MGLWWAMGQLAAKAIVVALVLAAGPAAASFEDIAPEQGRITLSLDGQVEEPLRYRRLTASSVICDLATWDGSAVFGEVSHCEVVGDRFWRRGRVGIELLLATFPFLADLMVGPPVERRTVVTAIGSTTLYGFAVDDAAEQASPCIGFAQGYNGSGNGYREVLVAYACSDGPLDDARAEALLHGLAIEGSFPALLP